MPALDRADRNLEQADALTHQAALAGRNHQKYSGRSPKVLLGKASQRTRAATRDLTRYYRNPARSI